MEAPMHAPIPTARHALALAGGFAICLMAVEPALADGGGSDGHSGAQPCGRGQAWDDYKQQCVKAENGVLPDKALTDYADLLLKAHRYQEALSVLDLLRNPNTAVALNYRGYATRKLGRLDEGIGYYLRSVALDPHYPRVREYLGEAYLLKGDLAAAEAQLRAIRAICGTVCESYEHLEVAIADTNDL
jgi:tetratricopeptide (TPR) repeat protein